MARCQRYRVAAVVVIAIPTLTYLASKFADAAIGSAASVAIDALKTILGL